MSKNMKKKSKITALQNVATKFDVDVNSQEYATLKTALGLHVPTVMLEEDTGDAKTWWNTRASLGPQPVDDSYDAVYVKKSDVPLPDPELEPAQQHEPAPEPPPPQEPEPDLGACQDTGDEVVADVVETVKEANKGHLFMCCIRCTDTIAVVFKGPILPTLPVKSAIEYQNGIAMTTCKSCVTMVHTDEWSDCSGSRGAAPVDACLQSFKNLKIAPSLIEGSATVESIARIMGRVVPVMEYKSAITYLSIDTISKQIDNTVKLMSVSIGKASEEYEGACLLPWLRGNFV